MATINEVIRYMIKKQADAESEVLLLKEEFDEINKNFSYYKAVDCVTKLNFACVRLNTINEIIRDLELKNGLDEYD